MTRRACGAALVVLVAAATVLAASAPAVALGAAPDGGGTAAGAADAATGGAGPTAADIAGPTAADIAGPTAADVATGGGAATPAATPTTITSCGTLSTPDTTYVLGADLDAGGGNCLVVAADNVTIDGDGNRIFNGSDGVRNTGAHDGLTVRDLTIDVSSDGIYVNLFVDETLADFTVENVTFADPDMSDGIDVDHDIDDNRVRNVTVRNSVFDGPSDAYDMDGDEPNVTVSGFTFADNLVENVTVGLNLDYDDNGFVGPVEDVRVTGNTFDASINALQWDFGYQEVVVRDVLVRDNLVDGGEVGYRIEFSEAGDDPASVTNFRVVGDEFVSDGNDDFGLQIVSGDNVDVVVRGVAARNYWDTFEGVGAGLNVIGIGDSNASVDFLDVAATDNWIGLEVAGTDGGEGVTPSIMDPRIVEVHDSDLSGNSYAGVYNDNFSDPSTLYVNATDNWWGASDGPGSLGGPYDDPVTGATAAGAGTNVTGDGGTANVHFDPFLSAPPTNFSLTITGTNSPVDAGTTATVTARVTNVGPTPATGTVTLSIDGVQRDAAAVTLQPGENTTVTLTWATTVTDLGVYTASVAIGEAGDTAPIDVLARTFGGTGLDRGACDGDEPKGDDPTDSGEC